MGHTSLSEECPNCLICIGRSCAYSQIRRHIMKKNNKKSNRLANLLEIPKEISENVPKITIVRF